MTGVHLVPCILTGTLRSPHHSMPEGSLHTSQYACHCHDSHQLQPNPMCHQLPPSNLSSAEMAMTELQ